MKILAGFGLAIAMTATAQAAEQPPAQGEPKLVCKRDRQGVDTGSNFRGPAKRICKTQADWDELERDARETFRRADQTANRQPEYKPQGR